MHQLLNDYFLNKEKEQNKLLEKEKEKLLLSEGLFEKVYSNTNNYDPEYPESEWDNYTQSVKYFKKVPIEIDWLNFKIKVNSVLREKQSKVVIYADRGYINEQLLVLDKMYDSRVD